MCPKIFSFIQRFGDLVSQNGREMGIDFKLLPYHKTYANHEKNDRRICTVHHTRDQKMGWSPPLRNNIIDRGEIIHKYKAGRERKDPPTPFYHSYSCSNSYSYSYSWLHAEAHFHRRMHNHMHTFIFIFIFQVHCPLLSHTPSCFIH